MPPLAPFKPLISIVIPAYNYGRFLGTCIDSVLAQTYTNWELLIIDNGSTDDTQKVIAKYSDSRIKTYSIKKNEGPVKAWALGYSLCVGEYFALLPADDVFLPKKLERQVEFLQKYPEVTAVGTYIREIDGSDNVITSGNWMTDFINQQIDYKDLKNWRWKHYFCIPTAIYSKNLCDRANALPSDGLDNVCDWDFHIKLLGAGAIFAVLPEVLTCYRWHKENTSLKRSTAHSQWVYSHIQNYLPVLRKMGVSADEIGECIKSIYASPVHCYFVDEPETSSRCAHLEALLNPTIPLNKFNNVKEFILHSKEWTPNSENRVALAAIDATIMEMRKRLLNVDPVYSPSDSLFPLERYTSQIQKQLEKQNAIVASLQNELLRRESVNWWILLPLIHTKRLYSHCVQWVRKIYKSSAKTTQRHQAKGSK